MPLTIFAQRMKQAREENKILQKNLAALVGVTPTTISSYEKADTEGHGKNPTLENAHAIAEALGLSLDWLCGMSDNKKVAIPSYLTYPNSEYPFMLISCFLKSPDIVVSEDGTTITFKDNSIVEFIKAIYPIIEANQKGIIADDMLQTCIQVKADACAKTYKGGNE